MVNEILSRALVLVWYALHAFSLFLMYLWHRFNRNWIDHLLFLFFYFRFWFTLKFFVCRYPFRGYFGNTKTHKLILTFKRTPKIIMKGILFFIPHLIQFIFYLFRKCFLKKIVLFLFLMIHTIFDFFIGKNLYNRWHLYGCHFFKLFTIMSFCYYLFRLRLRHSA